MPSGLPSLTFPVLPLFGYLHLLPGVMAVVGITLCEALLLVRSCNRKHETKADGNQVLFAYGITNVVSGFTGSLISGPSASRTAAMDSAGSCTQISSIVAAITVALVMVFFTNELAHLPSAALAGVVASSVINLIEIKEFRELWWMRRSEFWVAAVCLLSVLIFGPLRAVIIAFLLATIDVLRRVSMPSTWVLQEALDGSHFVPEERDHAPENLGIIFYRFGAPLYFANATFFEEEVEKLISQAHTPVKWFVLDMEAMVDIDTTGEEVLHHVITSLCKKGITIALTRLNQSTTNLLSHYKLNSLIDESRIFPTNRHAISAFRHEIGKNLDMNGSISG
jgi:SulP family sulfate permease